jgi:hypothetical protein
MIGPRITMAKFYTSYSNTCSAARNTINLNLANSGCDSDTRAVSGETGLRYLVSECALVQVGLSIEANDLVLDEDTRAEFANLTPRRRASDSAARGRDGC